MKNTCTLTVVLAMGFLIAATASAQTFLTADTIMFDPFAISTHLHRFDDEVETFAVTAGSNPRFQGVTILGDALLVADAAADAIQRFSFEGDLLSPFASLTDPSYVETDAAGNVYVTSKNGLDVELRRMDSSGNVVWSYAKTTTNDTFKGVDADRNGNVYLVVDYFKQPDMLHQFAPNGAHLTSLTLTGSPGDISIDEAGQKLYVTDDLASGTGIQVFDLSSGAPVFARSIATPVDSRMAGIHYSPELGTLFATDFSADAGGLQLAMDGTVLASYRPNHGGTAFDFLAFDIVHHVPEPSTAVLLALVGGSSLLLHSIACRSLNGPSA